MIQWFKVKYETPLSTSLDYIYLVSKDNNYCYCYFKFKGIRKLFKYWIDINVWETEIEPILTISDGLNIGKTIWGYVLNKQIIEELPYYQIMNKKDI